MPVLGIASLCPWERHLTLISQWLLCEVWKASTVVCFTMADIGIKKQQVKKPADMVLPFSPKVGMGSN